jgi:ketosteroid isomerase-like protein
MRASRLAGCVALVLGVTSFGLSTNTQAADTKEEASAIDSADIRTALTRFLIAFENLDWEAFRASFDDQATVFFPSPEPPERFDGRPAYEARFRQVFDEIRRGAPAGPPFQRLNPEDLQVQQLGTEAALVTFHLRNAERLARRTIVFRKTRGGWRIIHLHASNVPRT